MWQGFTCAAVCFVLGTGCAQPEAACSHPNLPAPHQPREYVCRRANSPIRVDGKLNDPAWQDAQWTVEFADISGESHPTPRFRTRAKLLWDAEHFYIGALLEEPHVWGTLKQHDQIVFHDNDFEVFIDPDGDTRNYYEIEVNPLNTIFDLFLHKTYRAGGPADHDWNAANLKHAIHVDGTLNDPSDIDRSWSVEMAIPWQSLTTGAPAAAPKRGDVWRVNFSRVEWRHELVNGQYRRVPGLAEDNWVWSPQGVIDMHIPCRWGFVKFK